MNVEHPTSNIEHRIKTMIGRGRSCVIALLQKTCSIMPILASRRTILEMNMAII